MRGLSLKTEDLGPPCLFMEWITKLVCKVRNFEEWVHRVHEKFCDAILGYV